MMLVKQNAQNRYIGTIKNAYIQINFHFFNKKVKIVSSTLI